MRNIILGVVAFCLASAAPLAVQAPAVAQATRVSPTHIDPFNDRVDIGCSISWRRYLSIRNTTSGVLRVGTPIYWTGKQVGQEPHQFVAPLYADVAPGDSYQIGSRYRYERIPPCQAWIMVPRVATQAQ